MGVCLFHPWKDHPLVVSSWDLVVGLAILVLSSGLVKGFVDASRARTCGLAIPDSPKHSLVFGVETLS